MKASEQLTAKQREEMLRRYRTDEPIRAIAAAFGVHSCYPTKLAKRHGYSLRRPQMSAAARYARSGWKPEADQPPPSCAPGTAIRARLLAGVPMLLIAADLDIGLGDLVAMVRASG